jgi:hypothetical protein
MIHKNILITLEGKWKAGKRLHIGSSFWGLRTMPEQVADQIVVAFTLEQLRVVVDSCTEEGLEFNHEIQYCLPDPGTGNTGTFRMVAEINKTQNELLTEELKKRGGAI